jgi:ABC-type branched-subunit amino acid transport system ATPase component
MLSIHNLVKIYPGPVNALQGVSLNIGEGLFGLLGPNGAGKSTLMNTLAGLLEPTSGSVTLDGADIVKDPRIVRRQLGYLPQDFGFFPDLTGLRMLELMLKLKGVDGPGGRRKIAEALLERVN